MPSIRIHPAGRVAVAVLLASTLVLAACSDDDGEATDATTTTTEVSDGTPADEPATDGEVVEVHLVDYAFEGLPESVAAGTRLTVVNDSEAELHEMVVLRIPDDEERSVEELAALPEEELETLFASEPAAVLLAPPGGEQIDALGDGTLSEPGRYAVICAIPTGADPDEFLNAPPSEDGPPEVEGGPPHFTHGMYAELVVE